MLLCIRSLDHGSVHWILLKQVKCLGMYKGKKKANTKVSEANLALGVFIKVTTPQENHEKSKMLM